MRTPSIVSAVTPLAVFTTLLCGCASSQSVDVPSTVDASSSSSIAPPPSSSASIASASAPAMPASSEAATALVAEALPKSKLLEVEFAPQSPFANWDALHEEACEEISLIMVHHFLTATSLSYEGAEKEIQEMIAWEGKNGYEVDVTVEQLGAIATSLYGTRARILTDVTAESLRREIARGNPVIIPAAGQTLGNPYFSGDGPPYHMLVVTGYSGNDFITNDPGTKRGERYKYSADVLINAIHDWTGDTATITTGASRALVLEL